MTQLPLHDVVYQALLAAPAPAALPGEIASCERLVPLFGTGWFYGLQPDGQRGFEQPYMADA